MMIKRLLALLGPAIAYWCMATILAQALAVGMLWWKGMLHKDKLLNIMAAAYDVQIAPPPDTSSEASELVEYPSVDEIVKERVEASLDLDLREMAIDKALIDLRNLQEQLREDRDRYRKLKDSFDAQLAELQKDATDNAIQEVRATLEDMNPKLAKEQIIKKLDEAGTDEYEDAMRDIVTMCKAMAPSKRKKIFDQFKAEKEAQKLHEILEAMLRGAGDVELIEETRQMIDDYGKP